MKEQNPYEKLGVSENASFEEIQEARVRLNQLYREDSQVLEAIEAAYDAIIMDRLRMRQEGKIKVPERIRFAERSVEAPPTPFAVSVNKSPSWLKNLIDTPSSGDILLSAGVFSLLAGAAIFYQNPQASPLSLLVALGFSANIYFLNRKEQRLGRSVLITIITLIVGIGLGTVVLNLLNSQNIFLGLGVEQVASLVTFFLFWLTSSFLR